jgi:hypothetical protein
MTFPTDTDLICKKFKFFSDFSLILTRFVFLIQGYATLAFLISLICNFLRTQIENFLKKIENYNRFLDVFIENREKNLIVNGF